MIIKYANQQILHEEKREPREPGRYWPSQASVILGTGQCVGQCMRRSYYTIKAIPSTNPASIQQKRKMLYGKYIEDAEINLLKDKKILLGSQVPFIIKYKNIVISGKIDAVVFDIEKGKPIGVEYKSVSGYYAHNEIWGTARTAGAPRITNMLQVILYLAGYREHEEHDFNEISLIYADRGTSEIQEFEVTLDAGFPVINGAIDYSINIQDIYFRFVQLDKYMRGDKIPPCDYVNHYTMDQVTDMFYKNKITKNKHKEFKALGYGLDFQCAYCDWYNQCKKDCLAQ